MSRICIVSRSTIHHFKTGGMETQLNNLVIGLVRAGHDVTILTTSLNYLDEYIKDNNINYYFIGDTTPGLNPLSGWEKLFANLGIYRRVEKEGTKIFYHEAFKKFMQLHSEKEFDVLISQSTAAKKIVGYIDVPSICIIHGTIRDEIKNRAASLKTFKNGLRFIFIDLPKWLIEHFTSNKHLFVHVNKIVAVSDTLKASFLEDCPECKDKVEVIYNGVDTELFKPTESKSDKFKLLYLGRIDREKGIDLILKAIASLERKIRENIELDLVGSGIHLKEFEQLAKDLGIQDLVHFRGPVSQTETVEYYQRASVFLFPSRRQEGHPMTISEAFCCGLPVISTKSGGLKDVVVDGYNGCTIKPEDIEGLKSKIEYLYNNHDMLVELSKNALKDGVTKYSLGEMVEGYQRIINQLIK